MRSSEPGGAEPDAFWQVCQQTKVGRTKVTRGEYIEAMWNCSGKTATISFLKSAKMHFEMENNTPDVQFTMKAFDSTEGDPAHEDQKFESLKNGTWAVASPIDSFLSKVHPDTTILKQGTLAQKTVFCDDALMRDTASATLHKKDER